MAKRKSKTSAFARELFRPLTEGVAATLLEPAFQARRFAFDPIFRKSVRGKRLTPKESRKLATGRTSMFAPQAGRATFFVPERKLANRKQIAKTVGKGAAGLASFAIPAGGTAKLAIAGGLASGALRGLSAERVTPGEFIGSTVGEGLGGAAGFGVGRVFGVTGRRIGKRAAKKTAKLVGRSVRKAGESLRKGVIKPKVAPTPFAARDEVAMQRALSKLGLKGSPQAQRQQMPRVFDKLTARVKSVLGKSKKSWSATNVTRMINKKLQEPLSGFVPNDPLYKRAKTRFLSDLIKVKRGAKGRLTPLQLFKFKQSLGKRLKNAFTKVKRGKTLTPSEQVGMSIWRSIDDIITEAVPKVKEFTKAQSVLFDAAIGLEKGAKATFRIPVLGVRLSQRAPLAVADILGRTLETGGRLVEQAPITPITSALGRLPMQAGGTIGEIFERGLQQPQLPAPTEPRIPGGLPPEAEIPAPEGRLPPTQPPETPTGRGVRQLTEQDVTKAYLTLSPDAAKIVEKVFNIQQKSQEENLEIRKAAVISDQVDAMEKLLEKIPTGRIAGRVEQLRSAAGLPSEIRQFNQRIIIAAPIIGKNILELGRLTDEDVRLAMKSLPVVTDTPEEVADKLETIREVIERRYGQ